MLGTLLELLPARDIYCYTYGFRGHLDYEIAPLVARAAGVSHVLRGFHEAPFEPDEFEEQVQNVELESAPTLNLFAHYCTKKISALCLADLPKDAAIWSGFLGDRVWAGKWLEDCESDLRRAVVEYVNSYAHPCKVSIVKGRYDPVERLLSLYARVPAFPQGSSWCELIDLQQRQYHVQRSLEVAERAYVFPLAAPEVVSRLLSLPSVQRARHQFYRRYALRYHAQLFRCPTASRFGAPLRASPLREKLDRGMRLARQRLALLREVGGAAVVSVV